MHAAGPDSWAGGAVGFSHDAPPDAAHEMCFATLAILSAARGLSGKGRTKVRSGLRLFAGRAGVALKRYSGPRYLRIWANRRGCAAGLPEFLLPVGGY